VPEDVPPPSVAFAGDRHVVRDDVEDEPQRVRAERIGQAVEAGVAAELLVDPSVVDDVVAVRRAGCRLEDR
jgi:hypothetical protein